MHLKLFVITGLLFYALSVCGGFLFYRLAVVYPQLSDQVLQSHQSDFKSLASAFEAEKDQLKLLLYDWAKWDDLYGYMKSPYSTFEKSNLVPSILEDAKLSGIYLLGAGQSLVLGMEQEIKGQYIRHAEALSSKRFDISIKMNQSNSSDMHCAFQHIENQLILFCSTSIQDSNESLPANGFLVFTRSFDSEKLEKIKVLANVDFSITSFESHLSYSPNNINDAYKVRELSSHYSLGFPSEIPGKMDFIVHANYSKDSLPERIDKQTIIAIGFLLIIPFIMIYVISKLVLNPLTYMSNFILSLKMQEQPPRLPRSGAIVEVNIIGKALLDLMEHVENDKRLLEQKSLTDALTGVSNRGAFDEHLEELWRASSRGTKPIVIALIDIDFFKKFNDSLGHQKGDEALKAVALALKGACRRATDRMFRYGGEEFAMTMVLENVEDLTIVMETIQDAIEQLKYPHPDSVISSNITISSGACLIPVTGDWMKHSSAGTALQIADKALYEAKQQGRNRYVVHVQTDQVIDGCLADSAIPLSSLGSIEQKDS